MSNLKNLFINLTDPVVFQSFGGADFWGKVDVPVGQVVVQEGAEDEDFYYIFSGSVEVTKALSTGGKKHLATLSQGDFFGEGALLSDRGRGATVTAATDLVLLKLAKDKFEALVQADPPAATGITLGIVKVLNARLQNMNERLVALNNVAELSHRFAGNAEQMLPAIFEEVAVALPGASLVLFGPDGLPRLRTANVNQAILDDLQMKVPDYANRLALADAPPSYLSDTALFCAIKNGQGQMTGTLAAHLEPRSLDQDLRFLVVVAEQLGHVL